VKHGGLGNAYSYDYFYTGVKLDLRGGVGSDTSPCK
jgi:hypothetical protein